MLNIIVCIKQVLDPEAPPSAYKIDEATKRLVQTGVPPVISPFDENALEAALRIKDALPARITAVSLGWNLSKTVLRKAVAVGADDLYLIEDKNFSGLDSYGIATVLSEAIKKIGTYDLILTGRQAADTNAGLVGTYVGEILQIPIITVSRKLTISDGKVRCETITPDGYNIVGSDLPALVTISNELGELRSVGIKEIMTAQKKPVTVWNKQQLGLGEANLNRIITHSVFMPKAESHCEIIKGETDIDAGLKLAIKLKEANIINPTNNYDK
jgi:electron transfer flavoprotein beta subunit